MKLSLVLSAVRPPTILPAARSLRRFALPLALGLSFASLAPQPTRAADITLTKAFLDSVGGFVNFAKPVLGSGAHAITNTLGPGDTVYLEAQTRSTLIFTNLTQGTAADPITVTNTGGQFLIYNAPPAGSNTGIRLWGAQHVRFVGTPDPPSYDYGIKIDGAAPHGLKVDYNQYLQGRVGGSFGNSIDVEIANIEITNVSFAGIHAKYEMSNASVPAGVTALLDGLEIHDCYIHDLEGEAMYIGWTSDGHPDIANVSIHNNRVVNTGWDGIQLNRSHGTNTIYNNEVVGYGLSSYTYGDGSLYYYQSNAFSLSRLADFSLHHNRTVATSEYSGSAITYFMTDTTVIANNLFVLGDLGSPVNNSGMWIAQVYASLPGVSLTIANNTLVEPDNHGIAFSLEDNLDANNQPANEGGVSVPVTLINNLIARPVNGTYVLPPAISTPTQTTNLYVATVAAAGFVGSGDYHLAAGSAAIDAGTATAAATTDFDYLPRPLGTAHDIGAYEFEPSGGVLNPVATGTATGSGFCGAAGAFNEPPTWDAVNGVPVGDAASPHTDTQTGYANRHWYIDFGADWAKVRIEQLWTRYRPYSGGNYAGFATLWWDDDKDTVNDGTTATGLNFQTAQSVPNIAAQQWIRDVDVTATPVTPQGRYLLVSTGATTTVRPNEFLFVGYTTP